MKQKQFTGKEDYIETDFEIPAFVKRKPMPKKFLNTIENFKRNNHPGKGPAFEDFGLSIERYNELPESVQNLTRKEERDTIIAKVVNFIIGIIILFIGLKYSNKDISIFSYLSLAFIITLGFFGYPLILLIRNNYNPEDKILQYNEYLKYKNEKNLYDEELSKYHNELSELKDEISQMIELRKESHWKSMSGYEFEKNIGILLKKVGNIVRITKGTGDSGVDIFLNEDTIIQCKQTKNPSSPAIVRELLGTMVHFGKEKGVLISTGGFTSGCYDFIEDEDIELWGLDKIIELSEKVEINCSEK